MATLVALYDGIDRIVSILGGLQVADQVADVQAATTVLAGHGVTPGAWTPVGGHWPGAVQADCVMVHPIIYCGACGWLVRDHQCTNPNCSGKR
jgi:hypothetical protein